MNADQAAAKERWSLTAHLLLLAVPACMLSLSVPMLAPKVVQENLWADGLLVLATLVLLCGAAVLCSRRLQHCLRDLGHATGEVIKGRLDTRVPARRAPREFFQLSAEFNRMLERVQHVEAELQAANAKLEERVAARTAELAAANQALDSFACSVSHDLRAPVRLINSFSELIEHESDRLSASGQKHLHSIRLETRHMNQMIEALLEMSRLARQPLAEAPVNLSSLADEIAASLHEANPQRDVHFLIQPDLQVLGDERLLRAVLENLLGNAWKFTGHQSPGRIEFGATDRNGERVFFIRDDGSGFDMAAANRLFTAFQRLHSSSEFEGVGMGLATVRRIIERHGGRIWAESQPGKGATFYFMLPGRPQPASER